jgi:hypothetical protein
MGAKQVSSPSWSAPRERRAGLSAELMQARNDLVARRNLDDQLAGLEGERPPMHGQAGSAGRLAMGAKQVLSPSWSAPRERRAGLSAELMQALANAKTQRDKHAKALAANEAKRSANAADAKHAKWMKSMIARSMGKNCEDLVQEFKLQRPTEKETKRAFKLWVRSTGIHPDHAESRYGVQSTEFYQKISDCVDKIAPQPTQISNDPPVTSASPAGTGPRSGTGAPSKPGTGPRAGSGVPPPGSGTGSRTGVPPPGSGTGSGTGVPSRGTGPWSHMDANMSDGESDVSGQQDSQDIDANMSDRESEYMNAENTIRRGAKRESPTAFHSPRFKRPSINRCEMILLEINLWHPVTPLPEGEVLRRYNMWLNSNDNTPEKRPIVERCLSETYPNIVARAHVQEAVEAVANGRGAAVASAHVEEAINQLQNHPEPVAAAPTAAFVNEVINAIHATNSQVAEQHRNNAQRHLDAAKVEAERVCKGKGIKTILPSPCEIILLEINLWHPGTPLPEGEVLERYEVWLVSKNNNTPARRRIVERCLNKTYPNIIARAHVLEAVEAVANGRGVQVANVHVEEAINQLRDAPKPVAGAETAASINEVTHAINATNPQVAERHAGNALRHLDAAKAEANRERRERDRKGKGIAEEYRIARARAKVIQHTQRSQRENLRAAIEASRREGPGGGASTSVGAFRPVHGNNSDFRAAMRASRERPRNGARTSAGAFQPLHNGGPGTSLNAGFNRAVHTSPPRNVEPVNLPDRRSRSRSRSANTKRQRSPNRPIATRRTSTRERYSPTRYQSTDYAPRGGTSIFNRPGARRSYIDSNGRPTMNGVYRRTMNKRRRLQHHRSVKKTGGGLKWERCLKRDYNEANTTKKVNLSVQKRT